MEFKDLQVKEEIIRAIDDLGFTELTEIQEKVIPIALEYRDLIGQAPTGTGKTLGFTIPILNMIDENSRDIEAVIMAPTRELALQITSDINDASNYLKKINAVTIYGGELIDKQINALRHHPQIIVATPGRLLDHLKRKTLTLKNVRTVVLDEADEMLNMGFLDDIKDLGYYRAFKGGLSFNLNDILIPEEKKALIDKGNEIVDQITELYNEGEVSDDQRYRQSVDTWKQIDGEMTTILMDHLDRAGAHL